MKGVIEYAIRTWFIVVELLAENAEIKVENAKVKAENAKLRQAMRPDS